jgi:hypothetical protein
VDAEKRIQELESQVLRLTRELQQFRETRKPPGTDSEAPHPAPSHSPSPETSSFTAPVATRAWPAWVSRLAVVFVTVAIILAAGKSASTSAFDLRSKALAAYSMAALLLLLGAAFPDRRSLLASLALGTGLAAAYFMTYAAFFITNARLFAEPWYALPVLFAAILGMTATVAWRRSYAAAVIAWPVVYYSFGLTASDASTMPQLTYALSGVALASAGAVLLHIRSFPSCIPSLKASCLRRKPISGFRGARWRLCLWFWGLLRCLMCGARTSGPGACCCCPC